MWFTVGNDGGFSIVINTGDLTERCWAPDAAAMISHERRRSRETRRRLLILWRGTHASLRNSADWVTWPLLDGTRMQKNIRMGSFIQSFTSPLVSLLGSPLLAFIGVVMSVVIFSFLLLFLLCWICVSVQRWRKSRRGGGAIVPSPPRHPIDTNGKIDVNWVLVADTPKPTNLS